MNVLKRVWALLHLGITKWSHCVFNHSTTINDQTFIEFFKPSTELRIDEYSTTKAMSSTSKNSSILKTIRIHEIKSTYELLTNRCHFHHRGLECNTWSNRKIWSWNKKGSRAKVNRVFPREHTGHSKHSLPISQENTLYMDIRWSILK